MVIGILTSKMGCTSILSVKVSVKKIIGAAHKNVDIDSTCKQSLMFCFVVTQRINVAVMERQHTV